MEIQQTSTGLLACLACTWGVFVLFGGLAGGTSAGWDVDDDDEEAVTEADGVEEAVDSLLLFSLLLEDEALVPPFVLVSEGLAPVFRMSPDLISTNKK